ncbi:MAG: hypothetical protein IJM05_00630 [Bacteroidales bacterium]|nr:hypothetical protein [Bacteroidales bacterium]
MKKFFLFLISAAAMLSIAACGDDNKGGDDPIPSLLEVTFNSLVKGDITTGELNVLPVTATSADGDVLELTFYTDKIYLPAGTYAFGNASGNYTGHFKGHKLDLDVESGNVVVAVEGDENYTLTGTIRLNNEQGTAIKISATGKLVYEFPTEYYYTVDKNVKKGEITANVYKVYSMEGAKQLAEFAVRGEEGTFEVKDSGADGTAIIGVANGGTWLWRDNYGTYPLLHGKIAISKSHGRLNFAVDDIQDVSFNNCELKADIVPASRKGDDSLTGLTAIFYNEESPAVSGRYELTAKLYFADGREFMAVTLFTSTSMPATQTAAVGKRLNYTVVNDFASMVDGGDYYLFGAAYYVIDGVYYNFGDANVMQICYKHKAGKDPSLSIVPMIFDGVDTNNLAMPEPLYSFLWPDEATRVFTTVMYVPVGLCPDYDTAQ